MSIPFPNIYDLRKVAEASAKGCDTCYKPTTSVLITPDKKVRTHIANRTILGDISCLTQFKDFFYICDSHLKDKYFCSPKIDEAEVTAKREKKLAAEKEKLKKEYEEKQKKKKEKEEKKKAEKEDDKSKDKDKDKDVKDKDVKDKDDKNKVSCVSNTTTQSLLTHYLRMNQNQNQNPKKSRKYSSSRRMLHPSQLPLPPTDRSAAHFTSSDYCANGNKKPLNETRNEYHSPDTFLQCRQAIRQSSSLAEEG